MWSRSIIKIKYELFGLFFRYYSLLYIHLSSLITLHLPKVMNKWKYSTYLPFFNYTFPALNNPNSLFFFSGLIVFCRTIFIDDIITPAHHSSDNLQWNLLVVNKGTGCRLRHVFQNGLKHIKCFRKAWLVRTSLISFRWRLVTVHRVHFCYTTYGSVVAKWPVCTKNEQNVYQGWYLQISLLNPISIPLKIRIM